MNKADAIIMMYGAIVKPFRMHARLLKHSSMSAEKNVDRTLLERES
jgi:hypothetical protein